MKDILFEFNLYGIPDEKAEKLEQALIEFCKEWNINLGAFADGELHTYEGKE